MAHSSLSRRKHLLWNWDMFLLRFLSWSTIHLSENFSLRKSAYIIFTQIDCWNVDKKIINGLMKWYSNIQWMSTAKGWGSNPCNLVCKYQLVMKMTCTITESDLMQGKLMQPKLFSRSLSFASKWTKDSIGSSCHGDLPQKGIIRACGFSEVRECETNTVNQLHNDVYSVPIVRDIFLEQIVSLSFEICIIYVAWHRLD